MTTIQHPSTKQDILHYLVKQGQASAQELADHLDISAQAIRRHLKDLEAEELIAHQELQGSMGRPHHLYELSQKGRDRLPDRYDDFAIDLLDTLAETVGRDQVGSILRKQWERKAIEYREQIGHGTIADRVSKLVELRQQEGFMAEWHRIDQEIDHTAISDGTGTGTHGTADSEMIHDASAASNSPEPRYIITEYNCAISHIAQSFPSVCGHELEMFEIALQDCTVERTHWIVNGEHRCGYLVQAK